MLRLMRAVLCRAFNVVGEEPFVLFCSQSPSFTTSIWTIARALMTWWSFGLFVVRG